MSQLPADAQKHAGIGYSAAGANPTTNAGDHVYSGEVDGGTLLTLSGDNINGYTATFKINLPITAL